MKSASLNTLSAGSVCVFNQVLYVCVSLKVVIRFKEHFQKLNNGGIFELKSLDPYTEKIR